MKIVKKEVSNISLWDLFCTQNPKSSPAARNPGTFRHAENLKRVGDFVKLKMMRVYGTIWQNGVQQSEEHCHTVRFESKDEQRISRAVDRADNGHENILKMDCPGCGGQYEGRQQAESQCGETSEENKETFEFECGLCNDENQRICMMKLDKAHICKTQPAGEHQQHSKPPEEDIGDNPWSTRRAIRYWLYKAIIGAFTLCGTSLITKASRIMKQNNWNFQRSTEVTTEWSLKIISPCGQN